MLKSYIDKHVGKGLADFKPVRDGSSYTEQEKYRR